MAVKYFLDFDTNTGQDISWRLDILQDSYSDAPMPLVGTGRPIVIDYQQDNDIYKPLIGSSAKINLVVTDEITYDDFNTGSLREYEVRLRYRDASNNLQDYWCGHINPIDSSESVTTNPFTVSFTATDGVGLLEQLPINSDDPEADGGSLFGYVHRALFQTGLNLPIYVESGIRNSSGDALLTSTSSTRAFYDEEEEVEGTLKDSLVGTLSTFNCTVRQSNGKWYIFNASTHGGSGSTESITWKTFNAEGISQADVVEDLRLNISSDGDLIPSNSDLTRHFRRPIGSVEARPSSLTQVDFVPNSNFTDVTADPPTADFTGWSASGSLDSALVASTDSQITGEFSLTTNRNRYNIDGNDDVWFRNDPALPVELTLPSNLDFDWKWTDGSNSGSYKGVRFYYRVRLNLPTPLPYTSVGLSLINGVTQSTNNVSSLWYDHLNDKWTDGVGLFGVDSKWIRIDGATENEWKNVQVTLPPALQASEFLHNPLDIPSTATMTVEFSYGQADTTGFWEFGAREGNSTSLFNLFVDKIDIVNDIEDDLRNPIYELVQPNHTRTISYDPKFISQGLNSFRERLDSTQFWRRGQSSSDQSLLEQIITQQKLNDFRDKFTYYEGTLINNSAVPLAQHHKPLVALNSDFTETSSCIMNGGSFDVKSNQYRVNSYIPNQLTDADAVFHEMNVDLRIPDYFSENQRSSYVVDFDITTTDAGGIEIADGVTPSKMFELFQGAPGDIISHTFTFVPTTGYIGSNAGFSFVANTADTPLPEFIEFGEFYHSSTGNISVDAAITIPPRSDYNTIYLNASIVEFTPESTPGVVVSTVVVTNAGTNLGGNATTTYDVSGVPGSTVHFTHTIRPVDSNYQLFAGNFDATYSDSSLTNQDAADGINSVTIDFAYSIPTTGESVAVSVAGNATAAGIIGVDLQEILLNFNTTDSGFTFHETSNTFTGVPGATLDYFITVIPNADQFVTNVPPITFPANVSANGNPFRAGENWEIPIHVTIPALTNPYEVVTRNIDISVTTKKEPYSLIFNVNNIGIDNAILSPFRQVITFDDDDFGDSITPFTINVIPEGNMIFMGSDDVSVDVDEAAVIKADGSIISLPENQFTASEGSPVDGAIPITIAGNFPSTGGEYTLNINVGGRPASAPATAGQFGNDSLLVPLDAGNYGTSVTANGTYTVQLIGSTVGITLDGASGDSMGKALFHLTQASSQRIFSAELIGANGATLDTITIAQVPEGEVELSTLTINYSGIPANASLLDPGPEVITLPTGTVFNYKNNLVANGGYNLSGVTFSSGGSTIGNVLLVGDESAVWSNDFTLSGDSTLNVVVAGTVTSEPNTMIVNIHNNIDSSMVSTGVFQFQYDLDEVGESLSMDYNEGARSFVLSSTDSNRSFDAASEIVISGGNTSLEYDNGNINVVLNPTYPTPDDNKTSVIDVVISPASSLPQGQPTSDPANAGFFGTDIVTIPSNGGVFSVAYVANGSVQAVLRDSVSWLASFSAAQATDTTGRIGHSGGIFSTTTRREATLDLYPSDSTSGSPLDTLTIIQGIELDTIATTASLSANGNSTVAHDDPESSFSFTVVSDGAWQIYGGSGSDAVGGGTLHTSPPTGSAGATNVNITFSGGGGTVWQGNNINVQPLGGGGVIGSLLFHQYRSIVTQSDYNSLQSSGAPSNIKNATFYITD